MQVRWIGFVAVLVGCSGGGAPEIRGLQDQVATVGTELVVRIDGTDPDGDDLTYGVKAEVSLQGNAMLTQEPSGAGVFLWTPNSDDLGSHTFDFSASDGSQTTTVAITIEVVSALGEVPIFRRPLGAGRTANPTQCVTIDVLVEDLDTASVTIEDVAPLITGATLTIIDGTQATWEWCPTPAQAAAQDRYTLVLSADDGDNPKTIKNYVIVLNTTAPRLMINEVDYDQAGTDTTEYIELFNPSSAPASLAGLQVVLVNGATSTVYDTIDLSSAGSLGAGKYLVIAGPAVSVPASAQKLDPVWSQDQIQNGAPDGIALVDSVTFTVLDALSYEGSVTAATIEGFPAAVSLVEGAALDVAVADANTGTHTLCRNPNGSDTNDAATDWGTCATLTPGAANAP